MDVWAYFRFTSLSVMLGCATFFFSYAVWVWRRRQGNVTTSANKKSLVRKVFSAAFVVGVALTAISYVVSEIVPIRGVMRLNESFAARARLDTKISHVAPVGLIRKGDVLTRFAPANFKSEASVLKAKHEKLAAELNMMKAKPLEIDEELTRAHQNALAKIELTQATLNNLEPLLKETVRVGLEKRLDREDKVVAIDRYIIDYSGTRNQSLSEYNLRIKDHQRTAALLAKGALANKEYQLSRHQAISSGEQIQKLEKIIEQFKTEIEQLNLNNKRFDQLIDQQAASLKRDVDAAYAAMAAAKSELTNAVAAIQQDSVRAQRQRKAEVEMIAAEMKEIAANARSMLEANTILAPRDGVVVYRSAAPNSVEEHGVVVVMADKDSAEVQFTIPTYLAEMLDEAGDLDVWVEHSVFTSHLSGEITATSTSPYHSDYTIVSAACQSPMDLIPLLANEELIPIQLTWHPPLLSVPLFQFALGLLVVGGVGIIVTRTTGSQSTSKDAETATDGPFANSKQTHTMHQKQQLRLDHGDSGVMLELLGNRLRESIFARTVDADLVASAEWAIDRYQGKGIKMIRQGFASNAAEDEDPVKRLENALTDLEDPDGTFQEDLTELLKTLQIGPSAKTRPSCSSSS